MRTKTLMLVLSLCLLGLSGCAKAPKPLKVYWPPPPADPKLEWITTFSSEDNFPKTDNQVMMESVIGRQELHFFRKPVGVVSAGDGVVFVADMDASNIRVVDFNERTNEFFSKQPAVGLPIGLALDSKGQLYVADAYAKKVVVFNRQRQPVRSIGAGDFEKPTFLAINNRLGRLYVSDVKKHQVIVFDLEGERLFEFGGPGAGKDNLYGPQGIAIDKDDRVFVAEQFNSRVHIFDADGNHVDMFGVRGDDAFQFEGPRGLAFDSDGHLYVAESRKAAVLIFMPDGTPLTALGGQRTTHQLGFTLPTSVYVDVNDRIYITDGMNRRMTVWQYLTPAYLAKNPLDPQVLGELEQKVLKLQKDKQ